MFSKKSLINGGLNLPGPWAIGLTGFLSKYKGGFTKLCGPESPTELWGQREFNLDNHRKNKEETLEVRGKIGAGYKWFFAQLVNIKANASDPATRVFNFVK
jgi:hypothetical protein